MTEQIRMKALPMAPGDTVLINGTPLSMASDGSLHVAADAKVLTREQLILDKNQADTAAKRIYFVLQAMSLDLQNAQSYRNELVALLGQRAENSQLQPILHSLATIDTLARNGDYLAAMELCRHLIEFDEAVVRDFPAEAA
jgi:flagellar biosynthesis regulator FlbT